MSLTYKRVTALIQHLALGRGNRGAALVLAKQVAVVLRMKCGAALDVGCKAVLPACTASLTLLALDCRCVQASCCGIQKKGEQVPGDVEWGHTDAPVHARGCSRPAAAALGWPAGDVILHMHAKLSALCNHLRHIEQPLRASGPVTLCHI